MTPVTCDPLLLVTNVKLYLYSLLLKLANLIKFNFTSTRKNSTVDLMPI